MPKAPQRLRGKYIEFDETSHCPSFKKQLKRDDQLSSKNTLTLLWITSQPTTRERVLSKYSTMSTQWSEWTSSYSRSESPSVAGSTTVATALRSDIHDDDTLSASTVIGTGQTGSPLAGAEVETDLFLKTVAKSLWGLLCVLDNVVI